MARKRIKSITAERRKSVKNVNFFPGEINPILTGRFGALES